MLKERFYKISWKAYNAMHNYALFFYMTLFGLIVIFLLTTTLTAHLKNTKLSNHYQQICQETEQIRQTNLKLQQESHAITSDPFYLEMVVRRNLKMMGDKEIVITNK